MSQSDYSKGYNAGRKKGREDIEMLEENINQRDERVYLSCLELALKYCSNWSVGGKKINNAKGYCALAKIFADNSISELDN